MFMKAQNYFPEKEAIQSKFKNHLTLSSLSWKKKIPIWELLNPVFEIQIHF